jgi:hypothetical protein
MKSIITALVLLSFCGCKKDARPKLGDPAFIQFYPEALAYVQLPINGYFIYKDSASGELDSVVVTQSDLKKEYQPEVTGQDLFGSLINPAYYYQSFTLLLTSYSQPSPKDWFFGVAINVFPLIVYDQNSDSAFLSLIEMDRSTKSTKNPVFAYPLDTINSDQEILSEIPSIQIEGKPYSKVEFYSNANTWDSTSADYIRSTYYWAKGVGIIKREIKTKSSVKTETLVRYE